MKLLLAAIVVLSTTLTARADDNVRATAEVAVHDPLHHHDPEVLSAALDLAKYCANEAGLNSLSDCRLIWQVASTHGSTLERRIAFLRRHSRCVLTERPPEDLEERGNCRWSRSLTWSDREPDNWPSHLSWTGRNAERWRVVRALSLELVTSPTPPRQCNGAPITWGGRMDADRAVRRRLVPLNCGDTLNTGYVRARAEIAPPPQQGTGETLRATVAAGQRTQTQR